MIRRIIRSGSKPLIIWFSRHTPTQQDIECFVEAFGDPKIIQVYTRISSAEELLEIIGTKEAYIVPILPLGIIKNLCEVINENSYPIKILFPVERGNYILLKEVVLNLSKLEFEEPVNIVVGVSEKVSKRINRKLLRNQMLYILDKLHREGLSYTLSLAFRPLPYNIDDLLDYLLKEEATYVLLIGYPLHFYRYFLPKARKYGIKVLWSEFKLIHKDCEKPARCPEYDEERDVVVGSRHYRFKGIYILEGIKLVGSKFEC